MESWFTAVNGVKERLVCKRRAVGASDTEACHFQGQCDICAEQWSPLAVSGDVYVTEMLTPLVNPCAKSLTAHFKEGSCAKATSRVH